MPIDRVFLGDDGPCLPRAAAWLRARYDTATGCDMSRVTVVLPGARAGRRLLELLAHPACVFAPPRIITTGALPELLYQSVAPVADPLTALLARLASLRDADRNLLAHIVPQPPDDADLLGWLGLSRELDKLHEDLAGELVSIADVIVHGRKQVEFTEEQRWQALAQLQQDYEEQLRERGLIDRHAARAAAIAARSCRSESDVVLIAAADLPRTARAMLHLVSDRVTALIHAPRSDAEAFDDLGCVVPAAWCDRPLDVPESIIHITDRPRDQAMEALRLIDSFDDQHAPDEITLGVGDETMTPLLHRTLDLAGHAAHAPVGRPVAQSRPATLLAALAEFLSRQRLDDFASLLRHPDIDAWLHGIDPGSTAAISRWLTLLDKYIGEHLLARTVGQWLGNGDAAAQLNAIHDEVLALVESAVRTTEAGASSNKAHPLRWVGLLPLPRWSPAIASILNQIYGRAALDPRQPADADLIRAIEAIAGALREQSALPPDDAITPRVNLPDAIRLTLSRLADVETPAASEPAGPAIELLGWLELQLDDAPALIITGFNEHHIPQTSAGGGADAFLPNTLREAIGLMGNTRRYARDAAALTAILRSRPRDSIALIAGRRGQDDEPLKPSRLLLSGGGDGGELARRILRFYPKDPAHSDATAHHLLLPIGVNRFLIPAPKPPAKPIDSLHVTAFRTYLNCPYRFYLKHVERLHELSDDAVELDALRFGNLAHEVLRMFGGCELRGCDDVAKLREYFCDQLDTIAKKAFGPHPPVPLALQLVQLRDRLCSLAAWQARQPGEGWSVVAEHIEVKAQTTFDIDGAAVTVHGRIDRIDRHESGAHRILDYKTGDKGQTPDKTHRTGPKDAKEWCDLQLPLYLKLAESLGITGDVELGYVLLPKKLDEARYEKAPWGADELRGAMDKAEEVIRAIRAGRFWPPREAGGFDDEFTALCMEQYRGREEVLREVTAGMQ